MSSNYRPIFYCINLLQVCHVPVLVLLSTKAGIPEKLTLRKKNMQVIRSLDLLLIVRASLEVYQLWL